MQYRVIKPGPAVRTFIRCFWVLEDDSPEIHSQTIVPDGRAELIINLGLPFEQANNGNWHTQPDVFFVGQITGPFTVRPQGPARTIGVRFRPEGASRFFRLPMFELTDAAVAVDQISQKLTGISNGCANCLRCLTNCLNWSRSFSEVSTTTKKINSSRRQLIGSNKLTAW
jgi:hypothetical protein